MANQILIIDNNLDTCKEIKRNLTSATLDVYYCLTAQAGIKKLAEQRYQIVILSTSIPEMDGLTLIRMVRQLQNMPIVLIAMDGNMAEKIQALEAGADLYLKKLIDIEELFAYVHALLRRYADEPSRKKTRSYIFMPHNKLSSDMESQQARLAGELLHLTRQEFNTLAMMAEKPGRVFTFEQIFRKLWAADAYNGDKNSVQCHMKRLRKKLNGADFIESVRGVGYRMKQDE